MPITVVGRGRARLGQAEAVVQETHRMFGIRFGLGSARRSAWLLQGLDDPDDILYVGEWESREALDAYLREQFTAERAALWDSPPSIRVYHRLRLYENLTRRPAAVCCLLLDCPAAMGEAVLGWLEDVARPQVCALPELLLRHVYEDVDRPSGFLLLHGWISPEAQGRALRSVAPVLYTRLEQFGVRLARFQGRPRAEMQRDQSL